MSPFVQHFFSSQDTLVIDTPRQRRQVRRYGNDNQEEVVDMGEIIDEVHTHIPFTPHTPSQVVDLIPSRGKQAWTKLECLKVGKRSSDLWLGQLEEGH